MIGRRLMDGSRRAGAMLALLAALLFVLLPAPGHAEPIADLATPAVASAHHAGDGDPDAAHHAPGAHCPTHCAGHAAPPLLPMSVRKMSRVVLIRRAMMMPIVVVVSARPLSIARASKKKLPRHG